MRKLSLNVDELQVDSFATEIKREPRGTVAGFDSTEDIYCMAGTHGGRTCDTTCNALLCACTYGGENNGTCDAACNSAAANCPTDHRYGC